MTPGAPVPFPSTFLPDPPRPVTPPSGTFDIAASDEQYRKVMAPAVWMLRLAGPIIAVLGLAFLAIGLVGTAFTRYEGLIVGPVLFVLAAWAAWASVKTKPQRVTRLTVDSAGVALDDSLARVFWLPWALVASPLKLVDQRGMRGWEQLPITLVYGKKAFGITSDAMFSVAEAARRVGLSVEERRKETPYGVSLVVEVKRPDGESLTAPK